MIKYFKQKNLCCGGSDYLVIENDQVIRGFRPACLGLVEYFPQDAPGGLPLLSPHAQEISFDQYQEALLDTGL